MAEHLHMVKILDKQFDDWANHDATMYKVMMMLWDSKFEASLLISNMESSTLAFLFESSLQKVLAIQLLLNTGL